MTVLLRDGRAVDDPRLDRMPSARVDHLEKYPLTAATLPSRATPVVMGVNWYANADTPVQRTIRGRSYWVIGDGPAGTMRGGHATCLRPWGTPDTVGWWDHYNQGSEGRCVEFAWLRALSLMNRRRYDITSRWHYWRMQMLDEWAGGSYPGGSPSYEGTSVRAGGEVMRELGAVLARHRGAPVTYEAAENLVDPAQGIAVYRWARDWDDVRAVLGVPDWLPGVPMLNSWGRSYPRQVIVLDEFGARLLREDGEFGVPTDK